MGRKKTTPSEDSLIVPIMPGGTRGFTYGQSRRRDRSTKKPTQFIKGQVPEVDNDDLYDSDSLE